MTALERLENLLAGNKIDRPPFMPAIYDLKPALLGSSSHKFGQQSKEVIDALTFEVESLDADSLTVGYDIYNIEAEAVGGTVLRESHIGMPEIVNPVITSLNEVDRLQIIDHPAGRMDVFIEAAQAMVQKYGNRIPVRGGISGPFSMATRIFNKEDLLLQSVMDPEMLVPLLRFCTDTIKIYAGAFANVNAGVVVFDSFVAPPLISPETYRDLVLPFHKEIFDMLEELGVNQRSLVIGGNTIPIIDDVVSSGATQFLLDFTIPLEEVEAVLNNYPEKVFRVNLPPAPFADPDPGPVESVIEKMLQSLKYYTAFIIGTGILPPEVPASNIKAAKEFIVKFFQLT